MRLLHGNAISITNSENFSSRGEKTSSKNRKCGLKCLVIVIVDDEADQSDSGCEVMSALINEPWQPVDISHVAILPFSMSLSDLGPPRAC